jgi:hypothetical protein
VILTKEKTDQQSPSSQLSNNGSNNHKQQLTANVSYDSAPSPSSSSPLSTSSSFSANSANQSAPLLNKYSATSGENYVERLSNSRSSVEKMLQLIDENHTLDNNKYELCWICYSMIYFLL